MPGALRLVPKEGAAFVIQPGHNAVIGRKKDCDHIISDTTISRHHCRLEMVSDAWQVVDLDSCNGTFLNGQRVTTAKLKSGDELRLGSIPFSVQVDGAAAVGAPAPAKPSPPSSRSSARSARRQEAADTATSSRSKRLRATGKRNLLPYYTAGAAAGLMALLVLAFMFLGAGSSHRKPSTGKPLASKEPAPMLQPSAFGLAEAHNRYRQCYELMSRKDYGNAVEIVNRTHELHLQLLERYPNDGELKRDTQQLGNWVRQLAHWADAREMERSRR